ncbi:SDR family NAD(P)-dependent oxidoreductase [Conexibacter sp. SYSU D00693]|uniref:SDR family NAD(P)-dependent oxidoreductase n=1 Tax=Conexibacter sp. SYSU D00693 TaxID=2812560 RepID=UPI00196ADC60|nr:SDR family NAD(P)-dependent oxidoreductase [Conexibacter sp. SYSU D00693]
MQQRGLEGRRIAVAGAGGALGPAVVRALAEQGAWVAAADRDAGALEVVREHAGDARTADLASAEGAAQWAAALGEVDGLLHLVGGWRGGRTVEALDLADLELLERLLLHTVVHSTRAFAPALKAAGPRGRFALVSSTVAQRPVAGNAAYAAAKAAAEAWTLTFAAELAEHGATANVVVVNALVTDRMRADEPGNAFASHTHVDDVAAALAYLVSDAAHAMNGQRLALHR